jgi:hypothetical protein
MMNKLVQMARDVRWVVGWVLYALALRGGK